MYLIDNQELDAIARVLSSKKLFRYQFCEQGECDLFEKEFAQKLGVNHAIILTSGTNALIAALAAAGIGPGDEVIVPSYTFVATAAAVTNVGAIPIIANIDETLGMSPGDLENRISDRTKALIPVHMDGLACDVSAITEIAKRHKLFVIEDVAQAIGASFKGRRLGSWGDLGCFSLNENKHISCGEGGVVVMNRRDFYERAFCIHDGAAQFNPARKDTFQTITPFVGASMRVSEISGAIMRVQLGRLEDILKTLRERKKVFLQKLSDIRAATIILGNCREGDSGSSLHLLFPDPELAAKAGQALRNENVLFAPVTMRPAHAFWKWTPLLGDRASSHDGRNPYKSADKNYAYNTADYVQSVSILSRTLKMDIDIHLSLDDIEKLAEKTARVLERV